MLTGTIPKELDNDHGQGTHPTVHGRGVLPPIPTIKADPFIHHPPIPSHVAQTNHRMAGENQDRIPLQSQVPQRAWSNAGTRGKTVMPFSSSSFHQYIKRIFNLKNT